MKTLKSKQTFGHISPLYVSGHPRRNLIVVVDEDTITGPVDSADPHGLLRGLLSHSEIDMLRYASNGAPDDVATLETGWFPPAAMGWLVAERVDEADQLVSHTLTHCNGEVITENAIVSGLVSHFFKRLATLASVPVGKTEEQAALMLLAAGEIGADILITNHPLLRHAETLDTPGTISVACVSEAIPMIGLYLRSRGEYILSTVGAGSVTSNKRSFWERAALTFVPSFPAVVSGSVKLDQERASPELAPLARAALRRATRALEQRDAIRLLIDQQQDADVAEDTIAAFESLLLFLMGGLDATARLANGIIHLDFEGRYVGWQKKAWLKAVKAKSELLSELFTESSREWAALETLRTLRNFIHAEGFEAVFIESHGRVNATGIMLPSDATEILDAIDLMGDRGEWGVRAVGSVHIAEMGPLIDNLLLEVLNAFSSACAVIADLLPLPQPNAGKQISLLNQDLLALHQQWQLGLGAPWSEVPLHAGKDRKRGQPQCGENLSASTVDA